MTVSTRPAYARKHVSKKTKDTLRASNGHVTSVPLAPTTLVYLAPEELDLGVQTRVVPSGHEEERVRALALGIHTHSQLVAVIASVPEGGGKPVLIAGNTRYKAVQAIRQGFEYIDEHGFPTAVHNPDLKLKVELLGHLTPWETFVKGVIENQHENVTDLQEARAHDVIRTQFGKSDVDIKELYQYTNYNRIAALKKLITLDPRVQEQVGSGAISLSAAIQTAGLPESDLEAVLAKVEAGAVVTARDVADKKVSESDEEAVDRIPPRNAAKLKAFLVDTVLSDEGVLHGNERALGLAKALLVYLNGQKTEKALINAFEKL